MAGITNTVFLCAFLYFRAIHSFPVSDNTLFVSTSSDGLTWSEAENACSINNERLVTVRIGDIKPKLQDDKDEKRYWVAKTSDIAKKLGEGSNQCPVVYYKDGRLYLANESCTGKRRYICMPSNPTDYSLMIYIGVGCITLVQIFIITVCAVKFSKKKEKGSHQPKKTSSTDQPCKEKTKSDKASKEKPKAEKPSKEKSKAEKPKKQKSDRKEKKKSKKKASKDKAKDETQGTPGGEQGSGIEVSKEDDQERETTEEKPVTDVINEQKETQEQKPTDEDELQRAAEAKQTGRDEANDREKQEEVGTTEQKSDSTINPTGSEVEKETQLGASASETAGGEETAKADFPEPPDFLLNELTSSFLAGPAMTNIVMGLSTDEILSSDTTKDSCTPPVDVAETTFSTTTASTNVDANSSPVDTVAVTDVTTDTVTSALCDSAPVTSIPASDADIIGFGIAVTANQVIAVGSTPAGDEEMTSDEKKVTEAGLLDDFETMSLQKPPQIDETEEVATINLPDQIGPSEDTSKDDVNV